MNLQLIYNPAAGRGRAGRRAADAIACLRGHGAAVDVHASASAADLTNAAAQGSQGRYDRVVVCGGDGSIHLAIRDFDLDGGTLAIVPLGTGDDFARTLSIPRTLEDACLNVLRGTVREVDLAVANAVRYAGVAGLGFDSAVAAYANRHARFLRGPAVYLYAILRVLPRFRPLAVSVTIGATTRAEEIMFAVVGNSCRYGGGIRIVPAARVDDGVLDYCLVRRTSRWQLLKTLPRAYSGTHVGRPFVEVGRETIFHFESERALDVYADGEFVTTTPVTFGLETKKLKVVVPAQP